MALCEFTSNGQHPHSVFINPQQVVLIAPLQAGGSIITLAVGNGENALRQSVQESPAQVAQAVEDRLRLLMGSL